jgi:proteasome accessory factor C
VTGRPDAGQRLRRLLAVLTWLARVGRAPVSELSDRFGIEPHELVADLELAACCGLPPYTPDQLMEILVDDEEVVANLGPELARARRLTAAEGFALAAAARAILATPGSESEGALSNALRKLEAALGARPDGASGLQVELGGAPHLDEVRKAVEGRRQLAVRYYSMSSDEETERVVDPFELVWAEGHWYLDAYCHRAGGMRRFRLDRLMEVAETGHAIDHEPPAESSTPSARAADGAPSAFVPGPDATVAAVRVDADGMWLLDAVPTVRVTPRRGGGADVELAVASQVWFERLLLRLGPHAEVLGPPALVDAGREAARRLVARYDAEARPA